jgi:hypothetical protein
MVLLRTSYIYAGSMSCSATQEFPRLLWNLKVHYRVYDYLLMRPILSEVNAVCTFQTYFRYSVPPPVPRFCKCILSFIIFILKLCNLSLFLKLAGYPALLILLEFYLYSVKSITYEAPHYAVF